MKFFIGTVVAAALVLGACGSKEPDQVVGVVLKCTIPSRITSPTGIGASSQPGKVLAAQEQSGEACKATGTINRRQVITVKPAQGAVYTAELPPEAVVKVGDPWPPK